MVQAVPEMAVPPGLGLRVALPMAALIALVVGLLVTATAWTAHEQNRLAGDFQHRLAASAVVAARQEVDRRIVDYSVWDEAAQRLALQRDLAWAEAQIGLVAVDMVGMEFAFVLDPDGRALYGIAKEGSPADSATAILGADLDRLLAAARRGPPGEPVSALTRSGALPAILAVNRVLPHTDAVTLPPEAECYLVFVDVLDAERLGHLGALYLLPDLRHAPSGTADEPGLVLESASGQSVGRLVFAPERPGDALLRRFLPPLGVLALGLGVVATLVLALARRAAALLRASEVRATTDALTGLPNRALLRHRIGRYLSDAARGAPGLVLLCVDLDGFKPVNDAHGHAAGDELLVQVAQRLKTCARERDVVARIGGDEFVVLLPAAPDEAAGIAGAERILAALGEPFHLGAATVRIGASIGVAHAATDSRHDVDSLLRAADRALYQAKQAGRHTWRSASETLSSDAGSRSEAAMAGCGAPRRGETIVA